MIWKVFTFILVYIIQAKIWIALGKLIEKEKQNETKKTK
jgi:hypothetical protein